MWGYEKRLQFPVKIKNPDARAASVIISQYGGPDGELGASLRYLSQRFTMNQPEVAGLLTDIGTEELAHLEMIGAIVYQLTKDLTVEQIKAGGFDAYFTDHTLGILSAVSSRHALLSRDIPVLRRSDNRPHGGYGCGWYDHQRTTCENEVPKTLDFIGFFRFFRLYKPYRPATI